MNHTLISAMAAALLPALMLAGCAPTDPFVTTTDSGGWTLEIDAIEYPTGPNEIVIFIADELGEAAPGVQLVADVTMPAMGHGSTEEVTVQEASGGVYTVHAEFQMAGAWAVIGTVSDGDVVDDEFELAIEVLSE